MKALKVAGGIVLVLVVIGIILALSGSWILKKQITKKINSACETCKFSAGDLDYTIFPGSISMTDVNFEAGKPELFKADVKIKFVGTDVSPLSFLSEPLNFGKIKISEPVVTLIDGDAPPEKKKEEKKEDAEGSKFIIKNIRVSDGKFNYIRILDGKKATLNIHKIDANISMMGNTPRLKDRETRAVATAQIEKSGQVNIRLRSKIHKRPIEADMGVQVKNQNLADLTPFFRDNDGVHLKGFMVEGKSHSRLRGKQLQSAVYAKYKDFDLKFSKTKERDGLLVFLMNLGSAVVMDPKSTDEKKSDTRQAVKSTWEAGDTPVSFILRGLKEAAIEVATVPKKSKITENTDRSKK